MSDSDRQKRRKPPCDPSEATGSLAAPVPTTESVPGFTLPPPPLDVALRACHLFVLSTFLPPAALRALARASSTLRVICTDRALRRNALRATAVGCVIQRLRELAGDDDVRHQAFLEDLRTHDIVLSGSMMLQAVLGVRWSPTDLDAWKEVDTRAPPDIGFAHGIRSKFSRQAEEMATRHQLARRENAASWSCYSWNEKHIHCMHQFTYQHCAAFGENVAPKLQVIELNLRPTPDAAQAGPGEHAPGYVVRPLVQFDSVEAYLDASFDFDFCRVHFRWSVERAAFEVRFGHIDAVLDRHTDYTRSVRLATTVERFQKYKARGFRITLPTDVAAYMRASQILAFDTHCYPVTEVVDWTQMVALVRSPPLQANGEASINVPCPLKTCFPHLCEHPHLHQRGTADLGYERKADHLLLATWATTERERVALRMFDPTRFTADDLQVAGGANVSA